MQLAPDHDEFPELLAGARNRERAAWDTLYRRFAPAALGYLRSQRVTNEEDLLSEVWLQVVRDLPDFSGDADQFRGWLLRITHHRVLDEHRVRKRRSEIVEQAPLEPVVDAVQPEHERQEAIDEVEHLLAGLPDNQRAVLYLRFVLDLKQGEIAAILGSSTAAVKMLQMRAVKAAARRLAADDAAGEVDA